MIDNKDLKLLISEEEIQQKIKELAAIINEEYQGKELVVVLLLTGALFFGMDLVKHLNPEIYIDTLSVSSYDGSNSKGVIKINSDLKIDVSGKDVLIVEDIIDTGLTLDGLKSFMMQKKPNSYKIVCLLNKKERRVVKDVAVDYIGFEIKNFFVVGYGFDFNEKYRNLKNIYEYTGAV